MHKEFIATTDQYLLEMTMLDLLEMESVEGS